MGFWHGRWFFPGESWNLAGRRFWSRQELDFGRGVGFASAGGGVRQGRRLVPADKILARASVSSQRELGFDKRVGGASAKIEFGRDPMPPLREMDCAGASASTARIAFW